MSRETALGGDRRSFEPTVWTVVLKARDRKEAGALIERYWKPCYFYIRRRGYAVEDAKDLTQSFFSALLEQDALARVTKSKGPFRNFLLACLNHFLSDERGRQKAQKRGGGVPRVDFESAEKQLGLADPDTPETLFRRQWALETVGRALDRLRHEMGDRFRAFGDYITGGRPEDLKSLAARIGLSESNVKVILHRARRRLREIIETEVARTVEDPADVEGELAELMKAVS